MQQGGTPLHCPLALCARASTSGQRQQHARCSAPSACDGARRTSPTGLPAHTTVGRYCTVGQACLLRSTYIHDEVIIGDRCILLARLSWLLSDS